jgi:hypothetical protein
MRTKTGIVMHRLVGFLLLIGFAGMAAGCAATTEPIGPVSDVPQLSPHLSNENGWWAVRFKMDRPGGDTRWEKDLLIAHRVIAPLILAYRNDIELWRFHRRSAGDATGHQFSFLFFASAETAGHIYRRVHADPLVEGLLSSQMVAAVLTDPLDQNRHPTVGGVSDPNWSTVMQDNWPYYIMGVSRMWLGMIDQIAREIGVEEETTDENLLAYYEKVNEGVTRIWQSESYHALLHHLNAIFGYEAMIFHEKSWKSF